MGLPCRPVRQVRVEHSERSVSGQVFQPAIDMQRVLAWQPVFFRSETPAKLACRDTDLATDWFAIAFYNKHSIQECTI